MSATVITRHSTMGKVLEAYPSAQRALFQRYHIGGCNSCGYQPGDTLDAVARSHNITDLRSMTGGIEAWSLQVDPAVLRYELAPDTLGGASLRPLRSTVSETVGCQSSEGAR